MSKKAIIVTVSVLIVIVLILVYVYETQMTPVTDTTTATTTATTTPHASRSDPPNYNDFLTYLANYKDTVEKTYFAHGMAFLENYDKTMPNDPTVAGIYKELDRDAIRSWQDSNANLVAVLQAYINTLTAKGPNGQPPDIKLILDAIDGHDAGQHKLIKCFDDNMNALVRESDTVKFRYSVLNDRYWNGLRPIVYYDANQNADYKRDIYNKYAVLVQAQTAYDSQ